MDIKLFSLTKGENAAFAGSKKIISDCANSFTPEEESFKNFSSPKRMLLAVSQALRSADAVIITVQISAYNSVKKMICSAFKVECEQNSEVYNLLEPLYEKKAITKTALENNSLFPKGADIFAVSDYKCCGFSITAGAQSIIVLPLDSMKTGEVVFGSLYDFLAEKTGIENSEELSKLKRARLALRLVTVLKKDKARLAFAALSGVQLVEESIALVDKEHSFMFMAEKPENRQTTQTVQEYIVSAAQKTRQSSKADFACAVSSAFASNTDDSSFIYFAIADSNETFVKKIFARKGENPKNLYRAAVEGAFLECVNRVGDDLRLKKDENSREDRLARQKLALITSAAVVGAAGLSALTALLLS